MLYQIGTLRWCTGLCIQNEDVTRTCQLFYPFCSNRKFFTPAYPKLAVYYMLKGHNYFKNRLLRKPHNQSSAAGIKITGRSSSIIKKLELKHISYTPGQVKHTEALVNILESRIAHTEGTQFFFNTTDPDSTEKHLCQNGTIVQSSLYKFSKVICFDT